MDASLWKLTASPTIDAHARRQIETDYEHFATQGLPHGLTDYIRDVYRLDLTTTFAGHSIANPIGKASGQLSMTVQQVSEDADAGLGFVVLKTLIAEDAAGSRTMQAWAVKESRMVAEPIVGRRSGRTGWTISWKGRGWWQSLDEYLDLLRQAVALGGRRGMLVVPSCKFHLPTPDESRWNEREYAFTLGRLADAFRAISPNARMPLEKDFSPTLAGSDRAADSRRILEWITIVPSLVRRLCPIPVTVGLKLMNAMFDDGFQVEMLKRVFSADDEHRADFVTFANRLFDPDRCLDGHRGVAFGGPDLSERNLSVLDAYWRLAAAGTVPAPSIPISATGDIHSGRMALEYALRGCASFQIHTFFQLPLEAYAMRAGSKIDKALHHIFFHPNDGLIAWLLHLGAEHHIVAADGTVRLRDVIGAAAADALRTSSRGSNGSPMRT